MKSPVDTVARYVIELPSGELANLLSRYHIPTWMVEYFQGECYITDNETREIIHVPDVQHCQACGRLFTEATRSSPVTCTESKVNQHFGYVAKICIDCYYYINGSAAPKSVQKALDKGHKPRIVESLLT